MYKPKLSFLISTYNSERFMERRLRNLLVEQTEKDIEVIIVDSQSPQNERDIGEKWMNMFPEKIKYIRQQERTPYGVSWLEGFKSATGQFCCNANTDDLFYPKFSSIMYNSAKELLNEQCKISFAYTGIHVIDEQGKTVAAGERPQFDRERMSYQCEAGPAVCWRNDEEFRNKLDWDLLYKMANEYTSAFDYIFWLYQMSLGYDGLAIPDILTIYVQRKDSIENSDKWTNNYQTYSAISRFFPHNFNHHLKHAKEFQDFNNLPPKEEWLDYMRKGKKWRI